MSFKPQPIKIAILAMGGEGGGVLADWIVDLGESNGYHAQTTSVPGVAQRTGATIYYVELFPHGGDDARKPVLALMPMPGDVDVVLASELMEAGRAVQRGLVTADRTTLLSSTHRVYSIAEKSAMGDGRVDSAALLRQVARAAKTYVGFDMSEAAVKAGSVISAVLFGALCGTGVLPFSRKQFEDTIERGGVGVKPSLKAFAAGHEQALPKPEGAAAEGAAAVAPAPAATPRSPQVGALLQRIRSELPVPAQDLAIEGVRRLIDYQDLDYAALYLDRLQALAGTPGAGGAELLRETARHLALWMSYEDTIRVADLKTRSSRFDRVRGEVRAQADQLLEVQEFMHPRLEEICETLPAGLGRWLQKPHGAHRLVSRWTRSGRVDPHQHAGRLPVALRPGALAPGPPQHAALRAGNRAHRELAAAHRTRCRHQPRAGPRNGAVPAPGQGLRRHPCARPEELRGAARGVRPRGRPAGPGHAARTARRRPGRRTRAQAARVPATSRAGLKETDMSTPIRFVQPRRIRFSDCDPAGIVFYPQYFVMFNDLMEAWVDSLLPIGFAGYIGQRRFGMPTVRLEADFVAVSRMGDPVELSLEVQRIGNKSLVLALACTGVDGQPRMRVTQTLVTTSLDSHRSIPIPDEFRRALEAAGGHEQKEAA